MYVDAGSTFSRPKRSKGVMLVVRDNIQYKVNELPNVRKDVNRVFENAAASCTNQKLGHTL